MKYGRRTMTKTFHMLICLSLVFGFMAGGWFNSAQGTFLSIQSGNKLHGAGQMAETRGGIRVGLPQWNGQDFSIVPSGWISIPLKDLPVGWFPPKIYPLPRDLDRDFGQDGRKRYDSRKSYDGYGNARYRAAVTDRRVYETDYWDY